MKVWRKLMLGASLAFGMVAGAPVATDVAEAAPHGAVTFTKRLPKRGDVQVLQTRSDTKIDLEVMGQTMSLTQISEERKREKVLGVDGKGIANHVEVRYEKARGEQIQDGGAARSSTEPVEGKTYVLRRRGDDTVITYPDGRTPPDDELEAVRDDYDDFGEPDELFEAMPTTPLTPGQRVPSLEKAIEKSFAEDQGDNGSIKSVEVTFKGRERKVGVFDVEVDLAVSQSPIQMEIPLRGELHVRLADAWPARMDLKGPLTITPASNGGPAVTGGGEMHVVMVGNYP